MSQKAPPAPTRKTGLVRHSMRICMGSWREYGRAATRSKQLNHGCTKRQFQTAAFILLFKCPCPQKAWMIPLAQLVSQLNGLIAIVGRAGDIQPRIGAPAVLIMNANGKGAAVW